MAFQGLLLSGLLFFLPDVLFLFSKRFTIFVIYDDFPTVLTSLFLPSVRVLTSLEKT